MHEEKERSGQNENTRGMKRLALALALKCTNKPMDVSKKT